MNRNYRITWAVLAAILLVSLLTACSKDSSNGSDIPAAEETPAMPGKYVEVITDSTSPLAVVATDDNDVSFWFYAVRNEEGEPEYINEFILTSMDNAEFQVLLTITFDDQQRVSTVTLPDMQGEMTMDYISSSEVEVSVTTPTGLTEIITVPNPYIETSGSSSLILTSATMLQDAFCKDWAGFPVDDTHTWIGVIEACEVGPTPIVNIKKLDPDNTSEVFMNYIANVRPLDESLPGYYSFTYQVSWVDDYDMWESYCMCMKNVTAALLAGDTVFPLFNIGHTLCNLIDSIISDSVSETDFARVQVVLERISEKLTLNGCPGMIEEVADFIRNSGDPCSRDVFAELKKNILQPLEIEVKYSDTVKSVEFDPKTDGKIQQISFAELCCGNVTEAGGDEPEGHEHELGLTRGEFIFSYETYSIKDHMVVVYEGNTLFDTGCVGTQGYQSATIQYEGSSHKVWVHVLPNCEGDTTGTAWEYQITCPEPILP